VSEIKFRYGFCDIGGSKKAVIDFVVVLIIVETGETFVPRTRIVAFLLEKVESRRQIDAL